MKVVNLSKNILKYTYNIAPKTYKSYCLGKENGIKLAKEKNLGKFKTFLIKNKTIVQTMFKGINPLEIPFILSAIAIPTTPFGGSPAAFVLGCLIASPIVLRKMVKGEISVSKVRKYFSNMCKKDYIKLDEGITETFSKIKTFTKLNK